MSWLQINAELYTNSETNFSLEKIDGNWYVIDNSRQLKSIPFTDIFNNPVFPVDFSNVDMIVKTLTATGKISGNSLDITNASLSKHFRAENGSSPSTPGFSAQGDMDTGFYHISDGVFGFSSNGVEAGRFTSSFGGFKGNIIQVVQEQSNTRYSLSSPSFVTASDGVSITPKYTNSKFLVCYLVSANNSGNQAFDFARKIGSGSIIQNISGNSWGISSSANATTWNIVSLIYLDSPTLSNLDPITYYLSSKTSSGSFVTQNMGTGSELSPFVIAEVQQ